MGLVSLDTNVLIRYLVRDDAPQFALANQLIQDQVAISQPVHITLLVALETEWVLRSPYHMSKLAIGQAFLTLLAGSEFVFEDRQAMEKAVQWWLNSAINFANCLIVARSAALGLPTVATFDVKAGKLPGVQLLKP